MRTRNIVMFLSPVYDMEYVIKERQERSEYAIAEEKEKRA